MNKPIAAFLIGARLRDALFAPAVLEEIKSLVDARFAQSVERAPSVEDAAELMQGAEVAVCSWGSPAIDARLLAAAPNLKKVIYAAGSVKPIVTPELIERGIPVTSGAAVIAENVAETTLGYIIVGLKNAWRIAQETRRGGWWNTPEQARVRELYGLTVGVVGAGYVGRAVLRLLAPFDVNRLVYDPFLSEEAAASLGARKVSLEELMRIADVVTLHAPKLPTTYHMINESNLALLKEGALLINTARGSLIDEEALVRRLKKGDIAAWLDVTDPEPPAADHPFRSLENVVLTPHIAGGVNNGRQRLGRLALEELRAHLKGEPPIYPVDLSRLDTIA